METPPDLRRGPKRSPDPAKLDRLPPHSVEAEQGVLGCILLDPPECCGRCIEQGMKPPWFYDLRNQTIYDTMADMYDSGVSIDQISLYQTLKDSGCIEQVGGLAYISTLPDSVPSAANLDYYVGVLRDKYVLRQMLRTCADTIGTIYESEGDTAQLIDSIEKQIMEVGQIKTGSELPTMRTLVGESIRRFEVAQQRGGDTIGIPTRFSDFDRMTAGLQDGDMIVIAGRPSMGKTSLVMNIVENVAVTGKIPTGVFSLEMQAQALVDRMVCSRARVSFRDITAGFIAERDFPKLTGAAGAVASAPIYIDDASGLSIMQLRARARRMKQRYAIKLMVVDYLQLLNARDSARKTDSAQEELTQITNGIKTLAKELGIPVVVVSQLNRELEKEKNRKPRMSDLRGSGSIEQDADLIGILYKVNSEDDDIDGDGSTIPVNLSIVKQRNGPTGDVQLTFFRNITRFETAARVADEDVPENQRQQEMAGV